MKIRKISKGITISFIIICFLFFTVNISSYGEGHWAQAEMDYLLSKGIISGYPDGRLKPDDYITRAEFVRIINNVIGSYGEAEISFKDVDKKDWFYDEVAKAVKSGYVEGYGNNIFRPNSPITRQEVAKIIVTIFGLEGDVLSNNNRFVDQSKISSWAREYVSILKGKGYISGYADGTFRPTAPITRAESMKIITNVSGEIINLEGEYSGIVANNLLVNVSDVELKDMHIKGDLFLLEGIGNGDVILDNITVDGTIYITGGGLGSVLIRNSTIKKIVTNKVNGVIHVVLDNSKVSSVTINENTNFTIRNKTLIEDMEVKGKSNIKIERKSKVVKLIIKSIDVEIEVQGDIESVIANQDFELNGNRIKKGAKLSIKDGRIIEKNGAKRTITDTKAKPKDDYKDDEKDDDEDDNKPIPIDYQFVVKLDKNEFTIDEAITLSGKVSKNNIGLSNIDITLKLGAEPISVDQFKTVENGEFNYTFIVPKDTILGEYKLIIKANDPVNIAKELDIKLLEINEGYKVNIELDKEKYMLNETIAIRGEVLRNNVGLSDIDITLKLQNKDGNEMITVDQLKTNEVGGFSHTFMVPKDTILGDYKLIFKINEPLNRFLEFDVEIIDG